LEMQYGEALLAVHEQFSQDLAKLREKFDHQRNQG